MKRLRDGKPQRHRARDANQKHKYHSSERHRCGPNAPRPKAWIHTTPGSQLHTCSPPSTVLGGLRGLCTLRAWSLGTGKLSFVSNTAVLTRPLSNTFSVPGPGLGPTLKEGQAHRAARGKHSPIPSDRCRKGQGSQEPRGRQAGPWKECQGLWPCWAGVNWAPSSQQPRSLHLTCPSLHPPPNS